MTDVEVARQVRRLFDCFSVAHLSKPVDAALEYTERLRRYDPDLLRAVVDRVLDTAQKLPTIAEIHEVAAAVLREQKERAAAAAMRRMVQQHSGGRPR